MNWNQLLGILTCLLLMFSLPVANWLRLFAGMGLGLVIFFGFGQKHSVMRAAVIRNVSDD